MEAIILQTIHVRGREPRFLILHLEEVERAWFALFHNELRIDAEAVEQQICTLLDNGRYAVDGSAYVEFCVAADGSWGCRVLEQSLYRGYVLRALRPDAVTISFSLPFEGLPTAAGALTWQTALRMAEQRKVRSAVRMDESQTLLEADGAPLFAVVARTVYCSREPRGVEGRLACEAIRRAGYSLRIVPLKRDHLSDIEELFYVDHRGVTALKSCDGKRMLAAVAERVAGQMEALVAKK